MPLLPRRTSELALRQSCLWSSTFRAKAAWRSVVPRFAPCNFQNPELPLHPAQPRQPSQDAPSPFPSHSEKWIPPRTFSHRQEVLLVLTAVGGRRQPVFQVPFRAPVPRPCATRAACQTLG